MLHARGNARASLVPLCHRQRDSGNEVGATLHPNKEIIQLKKKNPALNQSQTLQGHMLLGRDIWVIICMNSNFRSTLPLKDKVLSQRAYEDKAQTTEKKQMQ